MTSGWIGGPSLDPGTGAEGSCWVEMRLDRQENGEE
jgi:hypothetical protein